jgi:hypothetical protein
MNAPFIPFTVAMALGVTTSTAFAETAGPLPPGKPAGSVHQAQQAGQLYVIVGAAALIGIGVALATSTNGNPPTPTTVSTTSTAATP